MEETTTKKCPYCGEEIKDEAIKCRYCLSMMDVPPSKVEEEGTLTVNRGGEGSGYSKAGLGKRFLAFLVDSLVASLGLFLFMPFLLSIFIRMGNQFVRPGPVLSPNVHVLPVILFAVFFVLLAGLWGVAYHLLKDGFGRGQSLGKRAAGLMVVQLDSNQPCSFSTSLLRNLVQLFLSAIPGIGVFIEPVVLTLHEKGQRLGDLASRTQVIEVDQYLR